MKLNLVADYELPNGMRCVSTFAIHESNNLVGLRDMTSQTFPVTGGGWLRVYPNTVLMCESARKARTVMQAWERDYEAQGRLWDYKPVDVPESEAGKAVAA